MNFASLGETGGEGERLPDILLFQVREIHKQFFNLTARSNRFHDHANRDAHSPYARFAAHYVRVDRNAAKVLHVPMISQARAILRSPGRLFRRELHQRAGVGEDVDRAFGTHADIADAGTLIH
jgi:hypothetical protein